MNCSFNEYIEDVNSQLTCVASADYRQKYITYDFASSLIKENEDYFKHMFEMGISPYKALLFFHDYLQNK